MSVKVKIVINDATGVRSVIIDGVDYGVFEKVNTDNDHFSFFPRRQDQLTGDHYIALGEALNELNK